LDWFLTIVWKKRAGEAIRSRFTSTEKQPAWDRPKLHVWNLTVFGVKSLVRNRPPDRRWVSRNVLQTVNFKRPEFSRFGTVPSDPREESQNMLFPMGSG